MAVDAPMRRMFFGVLVFALIGIIWAVRRGDDVAAIGGFVAAAAVGSGLAIAGHRLSRRD